MFWPGLMFAYVAGCLLSWGIEAFLAPRPAAPWRRPLAATGIHVGVWTAAYALALAVFQRPFFAMAAVLAVVIMVLIVNHAKYRALQEPFVYQDFDYFKDALRHPRLYLPFLPVPPTALGLIALAVVIWLGLTLEPALDAPAGGLYASLGLCAALGLGLARLAARGLSEPSFDASEDLRRLGLIAFLWAYARAERAPVQALVASAPFGVSGQGGLPATPRRDLITIQSESFFDARRVYPDWVQASVLSGFDALRAESVQYGPLRVSVWGANTVRSEFSFLSGLSGQQLGVHRYNPYRRLAKQGIPTLVSWLKQQGYRTVCVHPYHASFYERDYVLPRLGFDQFIDIAAFADAPPTGPYVGDEALVEHVIRLLAEHGDDAPIYVHVITMENHGPLHLETVTPADAEALLRAPMPPGCADLVAYTRHLHNADRSFVMLANALRARERACVLGIFGDHVPIMAQVYEVLGKPDGNTDYLIWQSDDLGDTTRPAVTQDIHQLAQLLAKRL